jgi:hypothetical protein
MGWNPFARREQAVPMQSNIGSTIVRPPSSPQGAGTHYDYTTTARQEARHNASAPSRGAMARGMDAITRSAPMQRQAPWHRLNTRQQLLMQESGVPLSQVTSVANSRLHNQNGSLLVLTNGNQVFLTQDDEVNIKVAGGQHFTNVTALAHRAGTDAKQAQAYAATLNHQAGTVVVFKNGTRVFTANDQTQTPQIKRTNSTAYEPLPTHPAAPLEEPPVASNPHQAAFEADQLLAGGAVLGTTMTMGSGLGGLGLGGLSLPSVGAVGSALGSLALSALSGPALVFGGDMFLQERSADQYQFAYGGSPGEELINPEGTGLQTVGQTLARTVTGQGMVLPTPGEELRGNPLFSPNAVHDIPQALPAVADPSGQVAGYTPDPLGGFDVSAPAGVGSTNTGQREDLFIPFFEARPKPKTDTLNLPAGTNLGRRELEALSALSQKGKPNRNIDLDQVLSGIESLGGVITPTRSGATITLNGETASYHRVHGSNDEIGPLIGMKDLLERAGIFR